MFIVYSETVDVLWQAQSLSGQLLYCDKLSRQFLYRDKLHGLLLFCDKLSDQFLYCDKLSGLLLCCAMAL